MSTPDWAADVPVDRPSPARMYDYFLGGHHNFAVDREAAEQMIAIMPSVRLVARANRAFLGRAVKFLAEQGITQFIDIGSGIPTAGNVHELAQAIHPEARVLYIDNDPVAVAHTEALLADTPLARVVQLDLRQAGDLFQHPTVQALFDMGQPIALLLVAVLHFISDDAQVEHALSYLRAGLPAGSYLVISHATLAGATDLDKAEQGARVYARSTSSTRARSFEEIEHLFGDWEMVPPGLVFMPLWHPSGPDDLLLQNPEESFVFCGVACKP